MPTRIASDQSRPDRHRSPAAAAGSTGPASATSCCYWGLAIPSTGGIGEKETSRPPLWESSERNELRNTGMCPIAHGTTSPRQWPSGRCQSSDPSRARADLGPLLQIRPTVLDWPTTPFIISGKIDFRRDRPHHPSRRGITPNVAKVNRRAGPDYRSPDSSGKARSSEHHALGRCSKADTRARLD